MSKSRKTTLSERIEITENTIAKNYNYQSPATQGLFRTVGYGGDSGSIEDLEKAQNGH